MKRDLELIRNILLTLEADDFSQIKRYSVDSFIPDDLSTEIESDDPRVNSPYMQEFNRISYHIELLLDEGFIEAESIPIMRTTHNDYIITRITSRGHNYLDSVRNDTVWNQTKAKLGDLASSVTLSTITDVAQTLVRQMLGI